MTIVERINKKITEKGLNISSVEKELHFGNGTIRRWDTNSPSCEKVEKLANFLETTIEWIVTGKETNELTSEEQELLEAYRNANPAMQAAARKLLDAPELPGKSSNCLTGKKAI